MKIRAAARNAFRAFRKTYSQYEYASYWDSITNGWAAVSEGFHSFWRTLRNWGGTGFKQLAESAVANPHAGRGINLIVDNGASVSLIHTRNDEPISETGGKSKLIPVIERSGWYEMWSGFVWGMYCAGEVFVLKTSPKTGPNAGSARTLEVLPNGRFIEIKRNDLWEPTAYCFSTPTGGKVEYPADDVLHIHNYNPFNPDRGLAILLSCRRALTLVEEADTWNRALARGGGKVPGYWSPNLENGAQLTTDQQKEAQKSFDDLSGRVKSKGTDMVLSGAFSRVGGDVTPREADWLKGRQVSMREIAAVTGVPASLLSDEKGGSLTDAGVDSEIAALFKLTIVPLLDFFIQALSRWQLPDTEALAADWDAVPAMQEDVDQMYLRYTLASSEQGPLTKREARVALGYLPDPEPGMEDDAPDELGSMDDLMKLVA